MAQWKVVEDVRIQRDIKLTTGERIYDAVLAALKGGEFNPEGSFMAVSRRGRIYTLNLTASLVFERLESGATEEELTALLEEVYEVDTAQAAADVEALLLDYYNKGLIAKME